MRHEHSLVRRAVVVAVCLALVGVACAERREPPAPAPAAPSSLTVVVKVFVQPRGEEGAPIEASDDEGEPVTYEVDEIEVVVDAGTPRSLTASAVLHAVEGDGGVPLAGGPSR